MLFKESIYRLTLPHKITEFLNEVWYALILYTLGRNSQASLISRQLILGNIIIYVMATDWLVLKIDVLNISTHCTCCPCTLSFFYLDGHGAMRTRGCMIVLHTVLSLTGGVYQH